MSGWGEDPWGIGLWGGNLDADATPVLTSVAAQTAVPAPRIVAKRVTHISHNIERPPVPPRARF